MRFFRPILISVCLFGLLLGCDTTPGVNELDRRTPVLSDLNLTPSVVLLDNLPPGSIVDGVARFSVTVSVNAEDEDGDLDRVFIVVQSPDGTDDTVASTEIQVQGNGTVETTLEIEIPAAKIGIYSVSASVSDKAGSLGNQVLGSLTVDATGEPPVIDQIDIPDRITRPLPGQPAVLVPIVVHASDPDGLENILRVEVLINGGAVFSLCDDGGSSTCNAGFPDSGDVLSGDGQFTLTIALDSSNAPGENEFAFSVFDRGGLSSDTVVRIIIVD